MCTFHCGQRLPFEQVHLEHKYTVWTRKYCVEQTHIKQIPKIYGLYSTALQSPECQHILIRQRGTYLVRVCSLVARDYAWV